MGFGDDVMGSGFARGASSRGKRIAFGNGSRIIWGPWSAEVFKNNPNVAPPGTESDARIEWCNYYKGHRNYNHQSSDRKRWIWNYDFKPRPGEFFFDVIEKEFIDSAEVGRDFVYVEPNLPWHKSVAVNKDWGSERYQQVVDQLIKDGYDVVQSSHGKIRLQGVRTIRTPTFRHAVAALSRARLAILPEGGMHHSAAALGIPAVVIFGGFIPPAVTGYDMHANLTGNAGPACGSLSFCTHCREALDRITVAEVYGRAREMM